MTPIQHRSQTHRDRLDELYPPGSERASARDPTASYFGAVAVPSEPSRDLFMRAAVESILRESNEAVAGIDLYERDERVGSELDQAPRTVCDYVFFDAEDRILRAYRRFAPC